MTTNFKDSEVAQLQGLNPHPPAPIDLRLNEFLQSEFGEDFAVPELIDLVEPGQARLLSLPVDKNEYIGKHVKSYRVMQGVLHNPASDRRTTAGSFHVSEEGMAIADDKLRVPKAVYAKMLEAAFQLDPESGELPYNGQQSFVGLVLHPLVKPEIPGLQKEMRSEVRFVVPGGMVSNLDFVENIFGNPGDTRLPENDILYKAGSFTGVTGMVVLAPQLLLRTKKELGLPHISEATEQQKEQGMCWSSEEELYNNGNAFKCTHRTKEGWVITLIADNYYGYCKKEVKTQISFATNLLGNAEEEHAGGALVYPSYNLGAFFAQDSRIHKGISFSYDWVMEHYADQFEEQPTGYAIHKKFRNIYLIREDTFIDVLSLSVSWTRNGEKQSIPLEKNITYLHPSGYKVELHKHNITKSWYLRGTVAEGVFLHKPSTVSGGGKSEISKSIQDLILAENFYVNNLEKELDAAEVIINRYYGDRYKDMVRNHTEAASRPLMSPKRSMGSVIRMLNEHPTYTDEYNSWVRNIPSPIKSLVLCIKRLYQADWSDNWRSYFSVDVLDNEPGHQLKYKGLKVTSRYLRIGLNKDGTWRTFRLRQDFMPATKIQTEDDISVSSVYPGSAISTLLPEQQAASVKVVENCENKLFQRPDDAIHKGQDRQAESDFSKTGVFFSNYEPLGAKDARELMANIIEFEKFTPAMQETIEKAAKLKDGEYFVSTSHPRVVGKSITKNVRYLQDRPDLANPQPRFVCELGTRLFRKMLPEQPLINPVDSLLIGRRNNPPSEGIKMLAVYGPIHYQEIPELMMDCIATLSGKSPSTTGFGSEGALTKGPFNMLRPVADINAALVSAVLTGLPGFSTACGFIGHKYQVDHDISYWVPELWSRMSVHERDPKYLIDRGYLEKVEDFDYGGVRIPASRLGYRISPAFLKRFGGRLFTSPDGVFPLDMLRPELQSAKDYAEGVLYIAESQAEVARAWFTDGSIDEACPPLKAIIHIMVHGHYEGKTLADPEIRNMFTPEYVLQSDWYKERIKASKDFALLVLEMQEKQIAASQVISEADKAAKLQELSEQISQLKSQEPLLGTIGRNPNLA
ncbi:MAG: hypothetical protein QM594_13210 [Niabella sp.]